MYPQVSSIKKNRINEDLDGSSLRELIDLREPCFAQKNIRINGETISANFKKDLDSHTEYPGMSLAEVGKHMTILGSMAIANSNPNKEKHYYLASYAEFDKVNNKLYFDSVFKGNMTTIDFNNKKGVAIGQFFTLDNELIYNVKIEYTILHYSLFELMFRDEKQKTIENSLINPYCRPINFENEFVSPDNFTASLGMVDKASCVDYFDNYATMPARIGGW